MFVCPTFNFFHLLDVFQLIGDNLDSLNYDGDDFDLVVVLI